MGCQMFLPIPHRNPWSYFPSLNSLSSSLQFLNSNIYDCPHDLMFSIIWLITRNVIFHYLQISHTRLSVRWNSQEIWDNISVLKSLRPLCTLVFHWSLFSIEFSHICVFTKNFFLFSPFFLSQKLFCTLIETSATHLYSTWDLILPTQSLLVAY